MNHRRAAVRVALAARGDAGLAADAAVGVDEKFEIHEPPPALKQKAKSKKQKWVMVFIFAFCFPLSAL
jgi:hypothetical protein